jgi:uroporphyrinogen-III synthase
MSEVVRQMPIGSLVCGRQSSSEGPRMMTDVAASSGCSSAGGKAGVYLCGYFSGRAPLLPVDSPGRGFFILLTQFSDEASRKLYLLFHTKDEQFLNPQYDGSTRNDFMTQPKPRICTFESRRASEMCKLIEKFGGHATNAPSMREMPLDQQSATLEFAERLFGEDVDILVLMTGVGTRHMADAIATKYPREKMISALHDLTIVVRGPKPTVVLKEWGVPIHVRTPEPNTWREMLIAMQEQLDLSGKRVAVQEYGISNDEFLQSLRASGAVVESVIVYRWDLPLDRGPLEFAITEQIKNPFDVLMFTSAQQIRHALQVAEELGNKEKFRESLLQSKICSVGPTCSETLVECGLQVDFEASPPKMGPLVRGAMELVSAG